MATFPTLQPSSRVFTPGSYPHTPFTAMSGRQNRVRHSTVMLGSRLQLSFVAISQADMLSIKTHYDGQQGTYLAFDIPAMLTDGLTAADFTLTGYAWRYVEPPRVEDYCPQLHTVSVVLESLPPEGAVVGGISQATNMIVKLSLNAGTATGSANATGAAMTVAATLAPGAPSADEVTAIGAGLTVGVSMAAGAPTAEGAAAGADLTVTASLNPGAATASANFIDYPNFSSTTGLSLVSTDGVTNNFLYLTNTNSQNVGNAWTSTSRAYNQSFSVEWQFECSGGAGADGFTLQWHTANNVNGGTGGDAGRVTNSNCIHALSFKTYLTKTVTWYKNNSQQGSSHTSTLSTWRQNVYYWFDYDHSLSQGKLYYSTSSTKPASASFTLSSFSFDATAYYMGFGASTGGSTDNHILKAWKAY